MVSAVIFDLDGTVLANEDEWEKAFNKVLRELGVETHSSYPHIGGIGIEENWPILIKKYKIKTDKSISQLTQETIYEYQKLVLKVTLKGGFTQFVEDLRRKGIKTALATSSTWEVVKEIFDQLGIEKYFDFVTTGEEVIYKKPDPQIFEITAEKLGVKPEDCIVFEDSLAGIEAAQAASMKVIGIYRNQDHKDKLKNTDAQYLDFSKLSTSDLEKIDVE